MNRSFLKLSRRVDVFASLDIWGIESMIEGLRLQPYVLRYEHDSDGI